MHKYIISHMLAAATIILISSAFSCTAPIIEDVDETEDFHTVIETVEAGSRHSLVLMKDGSVWAFGDNTYGQLSDGTAEERRLEPVRVMQGTEPMKNVKAIAAGDKHSLFLKDDHTLWAAGYNYSQEMQMPRIQINGSISPVKIADDVKSVAAGFEHTVIIKNDGTVWTAGTNEYGQLGNGSTDTSLDFVQVLHEGQPMTNVNAVAAGKYHTLILKDNGTLWAAGSNEYGQLGIGSDELKELVPSAVLGDENGFAPMENIRTAAAGCFHTLILKNNGTLWATGNNEYGQLGIGSDELKMLVPSVVMGGEYDYSEMVNIRTAAAGCNHTMIIKENGTVWMTGRICYGITDNGQGFHINMPNPLEDTEKYYEMMTGGAHTAAGSGHTLILMENGELWARGWNTYGQLGDGTGTSSTRSVRVTIP